MSAPTYRGRGARWSALDALLHAVATAGLLVGGPVLGAGLADWVRWSDVEPAHVAFVVAGVLVMASGMALLAWAIGRRR